MNEGIGILLVLGPSADEVVTDLNFKLHSLVDPMPIRRFDSAPTDTTRGVFR